MWSSIDCGVEDDEEERREKRSRGVPIQGASCVNCSIPVLINNIKGKTWLKVDEMKSLYNAKTQRGEKRREEGGEEGGEGGREGIVDISFCRQPGRQDIAAEETNNLSFINRRLKHKQKEG